MKTPWRYLYNGYKFAILVLIWGVLDATVKSSLNIYSRLITAIVLTG